MQQAPLGYALGLWCRFATVLSPANPADALGIGGAFFYLAHAGQSCVCSGCILRHEFAHADRARGAT